MALPFSFLSEDDLLETFSVNAGNVGTSKYRKRVSSEVFSTKEDRLFDDDKKMKQETFFVHAEEMYKENVSKMFLFIVDRLNDLNVINVD